MASWHDVSRDPLHVFKFQPPYDYAKLDAEFHAFQAYYRTMVRDRPQEHMVLMADLSLVTQSNARNRKRIAKSVDDLAELMQHRCLAQAYVVSHPLILAALTAVTWIKPTPWPTKVFKTHAPAERWLMEWVAKDQRSSTTR